ncbi:MAG: YtxH-like protein [Nitrospira sp.]|jgi:gas vesicle protein|nr:YtxH-like protein [Nitrospira sp.]
MHKEDGSCTLFALMAGATVGAAVGLLFAPQSGSRFRSSLREYMMTAKDHDEQATEQGIESSTMRSVGSGEGTRMARTECSVRSRHEDHTEGDTGHDN